MDNILEVQAPCDRCLERAEKMFFAGLTAKDKEDRVYRLAKRDHRLTERLLVHQLNYFEEDGRPGRGRRLWRHRPFPFVMNYGPYARFVMLENHTMAKLQEEVTRLRAQKPARVFVKQLAEEPALFPEAAALARVAACLAAE